MTIANPYNKPPEIDIENNQLKKYATYASVFVASILITTKLIAYIASDSVSILSSLMDSTLDLLASVVMLVSVKLALEPADESHRYGHSKLESLAALAQALFITGSAVLLFYETLIRFIRPQEIEHTGLGISVMLLSIVLTLILVGFQKYVIKKTKSIAIDADHLHYKGDLLMNVGVIIALLISEYTGWHYADPICALLICILLIHGAMEISRTSYDILMDKELPDEDRDRIIATAKKHPKIDDVHDLRTRSTGLEIFIEFHIELDGNLTLTETHDITEEIELAIYKEFPESNVLIHPEPNDIDIQEHHKLDSIINKA